MYAYMLIYMNFSRCYFLCSIETCNSSKEFKMCPLCDENIGCQYWYLSDVCVYTKIAYLFDHPGTVFYAVFVSFWGEL